ncbi:DUF7507 domain-containing protein [Mediterraneibacter agrestimuris]|uniref:DUF7507 domain-containing protein n=1 Tax=Mediterraneibacter agrestimuris TaxID=2941333 RepID=UPI0020415141|nr:InlB B-repeat-containing protein [Mediterraneibacter agrestimuris]
MKKNFKRWLALVLAVAMVAGTCLSHADGFLSATDGEPAVTDGAQSTDTTAESDIAVTNVTEGEGAEIPYQGETEPTVTVQEIELPQQEEPGAEKPLTLEAAIVGESPVQEQQQTEEQPVQDSPVQEQRQTEEQSVQDLPVQEQRQTEEQTIQEPPVLEEQNQTQEEPEVSAEATEEKFSVIFEQPTANEGIIRVWADGEAKTDASYTNGQYIKEVKDNTTLCFEIQTTGNYKVDQVKDQYGNILNPESVNGNVSTYKMVIAGDKQITTLYREEILKADSIEEQKPEDDKKALTKDKKSEETNNEDKDKEEEDKKESDSEAEENRTMFRAAKASGKLVTVPLDPMPILRDGHVGNGNGDQGGNGAPKSGSITAEEGFPFQLNASNLSSNLYEFDADLNLAPDGGVNWGTGHWVYSFAELNDYNRTYVYAFKIENGKLYYTTDANWGETTNWASYVNEYKMTEVTFRYNVDRSEDYDIYIVQYLGNGHTAGKPEEDRVEAKKDEVITLSGQGSMVKTGYEFKGWTRDAEGEGTLYQPGTEYKVTEPMVYFYAKWEKEAEPEPQKVIINGEHKTVTYNGKEQSTSEYSVEYPEGIPEGSIEVHLKKDFKTGATGTNAGTYPMGLSKDSFDVVSEKYSDIEVIVNDGSLTVEKADLAKVKITGKTKTVTYTGGIQEVTGYIYDAPKGVSVKLAEGAEAKASGKDAGTYLMNLTKKNFVATSDNYEHIDIEVTDGRLKIDPTGEELVVNVKGRTDTQVYTGKQHIVAGFIFDAPSDVAVTWKGGTGQPTVSGVDAGTYPMNLRAEDFEAKSPNYTNIKVNVEDGWLKIDPTDKELVVNVKGNTKTVAYTGAEQYVIGYEKLDAPEDVNVELKTDRTAKAAGTDAGTYKMNLAADDFTATSPNYKNITVNVIDGWLQIEKADTLVINITGNSDEVEYTGKEQSVEGYTSDAPKNAKVDLRFLKKAEAKGTDAGDYYMNLTAGDFKASSPNYKDVTVHIKEDGKLTIMPITVETVVEVTGNHGTVTYTGEEQSVTGFTSNAEEIDKTINVELAAGMEAKASGTNAQEKPYMMGLEAEYFLATSENYTNLTVKVEDGWLKINPTDDKLEVTITGNSDEVTYNGNEQQITGFTSDAPESVTVALASGRSAVVKGINADTYYMGLKEDDFVVTSENYCNITKKVVDGKLTINPITTPTTVKIKGNTSTVEYDKNPHTVVGFTSNAPKGIQVELKNGIKAEATGINADTYQMELTEESFEVSKQNYTNVAVEVEDGWLEITPTTAETIVTVTGNHDSKTYTGSEQSVTGFASNAKEVDETIRVELKEEGKAIAKGTVAGHYEMGLQAEDFKAVSDNYNNLKVEVVDGYLDITKDTNPLTVTITGHHDSKIYTGSEQSITGFTSDAPANVDVILNTTGKDTAKGTIVGHYSMGLTKEDFTVTSDNYETINVKVVDGYLDISPITEPLTVTITGNHDSKVYNGSEQSVTGFTSDAPANVDVILNTTGKDTATGTVVGQYRMGLTEEDFTVTSDNYETINVKVVDGYLDITPITEPLTVTITGKNRTETYNGNEWTIEGFTSDAPANVAVVLNVKGKDSITEAEAGEYYMGLAEEDFTVTSDNYSEINVDVIDGWLKINPADTLTIHVKGTQDSKEYNKTPQSVTGFTSDAPADVTVTLSQTGKDTATGTEADKYLMELVPEDFTAASDNYNNFEFVVEDGWLEITPVQEEVEVEVTGANKSGVYDGNEQSVTGFTSNAETIDATITVSLEEGHTAEAKGITAGKYPMELTEADFKAESRNYKNLKVRVVDGFLTITPIATEIILTAASDNKEYDGTALTNSGFTVNDERILVEGDTLTADVSGSQTDVGDSSNTIKDYKVVRTIDGNEVDVTDSYNSVTYKGGTLSVSKRPITVKAASGTKVYDGEALEAEGYEFINDSTLAAGQKANITVEGSQPYVGSSDNVIQEVKIYTAGGKDTTDNYDVKKEKGTLTVTDEITDPSGLGIITKAHEDGEYGLGDTVEFEITVKNIYATERTITISEKDGVTITGESVFENVPAGEKRTTKAVYDIKEEDILAGQFVNEAAASFSGGKTYTATDSVDVADANGEMRVTKVTTNSPEDGTFALDSEIEYRITVKNTGNLTVNNINVTDSLSPEDGKLLGVIDQLVPDGEQTYAFKHKVTEEDILKGSILNEATAEGTASNGNAVTAADDVTDNTDDKNGHLTVSKTTLSTPENGAVYVLGEVINYQIAVKNDGNLTITNITVEDELTGDEWTIETLAPGEDETFEAEYKVTEKDVIAGMVKNVATAEGTSPDPDEEKPDVTPGEKDEPIETAAPSLYVDKEAVLADGRAVGLNEEIPYEIIVLNNGNLTVKDIEVVDELTGDKWTIEELAPGVSGTFETQYAVTEEDLVAGEVKNVATAEGTAENPQRQAVRASDDETVATVEANGNLTITKDTTSTPENGETYALNEVIEYTITATNSGNQTLENIVVTDELTGDEWTIETLAPGASETFTTEYTVTEEDIKAGSVVNVAAGTADKENPDGPEPEIDPGEREVETEEQNPNMTVVKTVTSVPEEGNTYEIGEVITYEIEVVNTGNVTLNNVVIMDNLNAAGRVTWADNIEVNDDNEAIIDTLAPGVEVTLECSYEVVRADAGNDLVNAAIGDSDETEPTEPSTTEPTEVEDTYTLTINYIYSDGTTAAPSVNAQYLEGETFGYTSPIISGYTADYAFVRTGAEGMPARDVVITVVYTENPVVVPTPTPTPDGDTTPTPAPGEDTTPTPTPGGDTTPTPTPGGDTTPTPTPEGDAAPTPTPEGDAAPTPTPAPGGDAAPATPAVPTPAVTPAVPTPGDGTTGGEITTDDNGEVEVVPVVDEEVPLANRDLDDHECCVLHFLLMLIAMIVYAAYTRSMKKRQERIAELVEELEAEMLKRKQQESAE